jgi:DNA-directed RNA polymerase specialized sigma24 family protein
VFHGLPTSKPSRRYRFLCLRISGSLTVAKKPFDELLDWLDPDPEISARKYETIRAGLIRLFTSHGISDAAFYADETIDRVMKRLPEIRPTFVGEPARYFTGVARNIVREANRNKEVVPEVMPEQGTEENADDEMLDCLKQCLKELPQERQELILDYHLYHGRAKVELHREMAAELAITEGALRTRAHHLRVSLEDCVLKCLQKDLGTQNPLATT